MRRSPPSPPLLDRSFDSPQGAAWEGRGNRKGGDFLQSFTINETVEIAAWGTGD